MNDHGGSGTQQDEPPGAEPSGHHDNQGDASTGAARDPNLAIGDGSSSAFQKYVKSSQVGMPHSDSEQLFKRNKYSSLPPSMRHSDFPLSLVQANSIDSGDHDGCDEDDDDGLSDHQFTSEQQKEGKSKKRGKGSSADENSKSKKQRLIWTPELHARFLNAVNHLGVKNAVPKTILQLMNVEGMTRENVASHLQKYRLYLKRLAGLPPNAPLSAETLQQVQSVQQAMQQQIQAGFQKSQGALQLGGSVGFTSSPLALASTTPLTLSLAGLQAPQFDLLTQLQLAAVAPNPAVAAAAATPAAAAAVAAAAAAQGLQNTTLQTASALNALRQNSLLGSMGVLPNLLPLAGLSPIHLASITGFNPSLLGTSSLNSVINPLAGQALLLPGTNMPSGLIPSSQAPSQPFQ